MDAYCGGGPMITYLHVLVVCTKKDSNPQTIATNHGLSPPSSHDDIAPYVHVHVPPPPNPVASSTSSPSPSSHLPAWSSPPVSISGECCTWSNTRSQLCNPL